MLFFCNTHSKQQQYSQIIIKKACYHLLKMASQEGPSAPFLCEPLKEREGKSNKTKHEGLTGQEGFSSTLKGDSGLIYLNLIDQPRS